MTGRTAELLRVVAAVNARRSDVPLRDMSAVAHRSPFDLHRRLRRLLGETPKAYLVRVRLARAAADLVSGTGPVAAVAARHGFGPEVFSRSFRRHLGRSPTSYRRRGLDVTDPHHVLVHAAATAASAPCLRLFRLSTSDRSTAMEIKISVTDIPIVHALVMRRTVSRDGIAAALAEILPTVFTAAQREGLAMSGPPFTRYPEVSMGSVVLEAGVPLAAPPPPLADPGIEPLTIPAGRAAIAVHVGPYDTLGETYALIEEWMRETGHAGGGPSYEIYLTDPGERPDPATWETEIVQPLAQARDQPAFVNASANITRMSLGPRRYVSLYTSS